MSFNPSSTLLELPRPAVAVDTLDTATRPTLEICTAAIGGTHTVALSRQLLEAQSVQIESHSRPDGSAPLVANRPNPVTISRKIEVPGNPEDYPALRSDSVDTFNRILERLVDNPGVALDPKSLIADFDGIPKKPWAVAALRKLIRGWESELEEFLDLEGITGEWITHKGTRVFAVSQHDLRVLKAVRAMQRKDKERRQAEKIFAAEETRAIWEDDDEDNTPSVVQPKILESEDKLSQNERVVLAYLSNLSVKSEVDYPSQDKLVDKIIEASKRQNLSRDKAEQLIKNLVEQELLFGYRSGGKPYVTTNANVAFEKKRQQRETGKDEAKSRQEQKVDLDLSAELVEALIGLGANGGKYTIHKLWAQLQLRKGVVVNHQKPTREEVDAIKSTARSLVDRGILFATDERAKFIVGFAQGQYRHFKDMDPAQRKTYLKAHIDTIPTR